MCLGLDIFMAKKACFALGQQACTLAPGLSLASLVAQEAARLLDQALAGPPAADPSQPPSRYTFGPWEGERQEGDERGQGASTLELGCCFLSVGPTPIEVLEAFPASPRCLDRTGLWLHLHPAPVSSWTSPHPTLLSLCVLQDYGWFAGLLQG